MAPNRRKAAAAHSNWKVGDLVLAKVKGFPAWPALVSEPEEWGQSADWKKVFVYFFGTRQIGFCNPADVEPFTEEKKHSLVVKKRQGKSADFVRAVREIVDVYEKLKKHQVDEINSIEETNTGDGGQSANTSSHVVSKDREDAFGATIDSKLKSSSSSTVENDLAVPTEDGPTGTQALALSDKPIISEQPTDKPGNKETSKLIAYSSKKKRRLQCKDCVTERNAPSAKKPRSSRVESYKFQSSLTSCSDGVKSAEEVVEILLRNLEIESNLHRRVNLFFLVDSITRCSQGLKGNVGAYPSVIQRMLPRLLSAVAPPGNIGHENRRQCLKVLRLWLERRILPESFIRQHIRELDSLNASSSAGPYSCRSARTERPMDDPVREMEGMLVDEYGSNSSFQLPGFCMPCMLKHEDEGSDSDGKSFEVVTPEHNRETPEESEIATGNEKHRHILEDVDGELEMEDVTPSCDTEMNLTSMVSGENALQRSHDQQHSLPPVPRPQVVPPPLPSSPLHNHLLLLVLWQVPTLMALIQRLII